MSIDQIWHFRLLGRLSAQRGQQEITRFRTQKTAALLAYLAYYVHRSHPRDVLIELFWPDVDRDAGRNNLSVALNSLRRQLEPPDVPAGAVVISDRSHVRLNPEAIHSDAVEFAAAVQAAMQEDDGSRRIKALSAAVEMMHGPLLPGYYEEWVNTERDRLTDLHLSALRRLITSLAQAQDLERALDYARRALQADPLREEFHRSVMRLCVALGRPDAALDQFADLQRHLAESLGATPSAGTRELAMQIEGGSGAKSRHDRTTPPTHRVGGTGRTLPTAARAATVPLPAPTGYLPVQFTRFFGRQKEIDQLLAWLTPPTEQQLPGHSQARMVRLVTLTGPGGAGKTRLALEVAQRLRGLFRGGACFVPLADLTDIEGLLDKIRDSLMLPRSAEAAPLEQIVAALSSDSTLLLLDNFEHLAESGAPQVRMLLERLPALTLLVTSRQSLDLEGERELTILPLATPTRPGLPERLLEFPSVQMFVDRAQGRRVDFQITRKNAADIAALCVRLEGVPLAIELAAAWAKILTPAQMLAQLDRRFAFLVSRRADVPERHRSLWAVIEGSYSLLPPDLQRLFARLSVFRGGWSSEAAAAICTIDGGNMMTTSNSWDAALLYFPDSSSTHSLNALQTLEALNQLRARSLIIAEEVEQTEADSETANSMRCRMLETLREYAQAQLMPEEQEHLARRHAHYYLHLAQAAKPHLTGTDRLIWLERLEAEHDNLRAAISWFARKHDDPQADESRESALYLAESLWRFWWTRGYLSEGRIHLKAALAGYVPRTSLHADALHAAACLAHLQGDHEEAVTLIMRAIEIHCEVGDLSGEASDLGVLGDLHNNRGDHTTARETLLHALGIHRELGDRQGEAWNLGSLGYIARELGDYTAARSLLEQAVMIMRDLGLQADAAAFLGSLAYVASSQGDYAEARALFDQELAICREIGNRMGEAWTLGSLGFVAREQEDYIEARALLEQALAINREVGNRGGAAWNLDNLGDIVRELGDYTEARSLLEQALAINREIDSRPSDAWNLAHLGHVARDQGEITRARRLYLEALALMQHIGNRSGMIEVIEAYALLCIKAGHEEQAARFYGSACECRQSLGKAFSPRELAEQQRSVAALRVSLGEKRFDAAWSDGQTLNLQQAITLVQEPWAAM